MKALRLSLAALAAVSLMTVSALAAEASPTGTWKFSTQGRQGGQAIERTVMLEEKGGKVTGTMKGFEAGQFNIPDTAIGDGTFKDGVVSFTVTTEFNGNKRVSKYEGKLAGDTITGTTERPGRDGGAAQKSEWVAKRSK
jgi:hypothetical protein